MAAALDMPPVLTYSSYNLSNWQRLDAAQPVELGNIVCLHNFLGGIGEHSMLLPPPLLLPPPPLVAGRRRRCVAVQLPQLALMPREPLAAPSACLLPALLLPLLLVMLPLRGNAAIAVDNDAARACGRAISLPCFCSCATNDCNGLGACR